MSVFLNKYNDRHLPFPPGGTTAYGSPEIKNLIEIVNQNVDPGSSNFTSLGDILQNLIESLEKCKSQVIVHDNHMKENNIMFAYVFHSARHRTEKFYRLLKKLSKCVRRWKEVELVNHIDRLLVVLRDTENNSRSTSYLPNVLLVDYILSQLKVTFELHLKLASYAFETAVLLRSKASIGHFPMTALIFFSSVSRIRLISISMATVLARSFESIRPIYISMQKVIADETVDIPLLTPEIQRENKNFCWCKENTEAPSKKRKRIAKRNHKMEVSETEETKISEIPITHISDDHHQVVVKDQELRIEDFHQPTTVENIGEPVERIESLPTYQKTSLNKCKQKHQNSKEKKDHLHQIHNASSSKKKKRRRKRKGASIN